MNPLFKLYNKRVVVYKSVKLTNKFARTLNIKEEAKDSTNFEVTKVAVGFIFFMLRTQRKMSDAKPCSAPLTTCTKHFLGNSEFLSSLVFLEVCLMLYFI